MQHTLKPLAEGQAVGEERVSEEARQGVGER